MPPKKRLSIGRKTPKAKRISEARLEESEALQELRLEDQRSR